ncbi:DNA mismatch repair protein Mlh3 (MutL protein homolog 3) [Durusdinium trenchii]|uniref:DNA mismatch repair protein Mlh3 (MutL protein homolog 3) n=1 Tax=Durusdinium trenchii TaxID=1381693 RepID=A0ABP0IVF8_9DINO
MAGSDSGIFNWELLDEAATVTTLTLDQPEVDEKEKELGLAVETQTSVLSRPVNTRLAKARSIKEAFGGAITAGSEQGMGGGRSREIHHYHEDKESKELARRASEEAAALRESMMKERKRVQEQQHQLDQQHQETLRRLEQHAAEERAAAERRLREEEEKRRREAQEALQRLAEQEREAEARLVAEIQKERDNIQKQKHEKWLRLKRDYPIPAYLEPYVNEVTENAELDGARGRFVNVAMLGDSGTGKSSLIRAILKHFDITLPEDEMPKISMEGDGTLEPARFSLANLGQVSLWDLPGQGTTKICSRTYLCNMGLKYFDLVVIVTDGRWSEGDASLLAAIRFADIRCLVARSKVDLAVEAGKEDQGWSQQETLQHVSKKLQDQTGLTPGRIHLVTSRPRFWNEFGSVEILCQKLEGEVRASLAGESVEEMFDEQLGAADVHMHSTEDWEMIDGESTRSRAVHVIIVPCCFNLLLAPYCLELCEFLVAAQKPSRWSTVLALLNVLQYQPEVDHVSWTDSTGRYKRYSAMKLRGGVVVPSLARAAEEMVLNAIDAEASMVEVELQESSVGCALEVRDNGLGIDPSDFSLLGHRGARGGQGRGESLAALVARCERVLILSKVASKETWCKCFERGIAVRCEPSGSPRGGVGTTLRVEGFLACRKGPSELRRRLDRMALLRPQLALRLRTGPREVEIIDLKQEDVMSRMQRVLGLSCARALCRVQLSSSRSACSLEGVISRLKDGHASDQFMFLYINGRFVEETPIHTSIANFYATSSFSKVQSGRGPQSIAAAAAGNLRPLFVLNLMCPVEWYDLNFLPDRSVAQFRDWKQPIYFILNCLRRVWFERNAEPDHSPASLKRRPEQGRLTAVLQLKCRKF